MFHRHPFLSLVTFAYMGFVGLVTLTPESRAPIPIGLVVRVLDAFHRRGYLETLTVYRVEFLANIAMFVPIGVFLLLLVGAERWWIAVFLPFFMAAFIETAQRSIPGRVPDPRDVVANTLGGIAGVFLAMILTLPGTLRRRRRKREIAAAEAAGYYGLSDR
jgi:glycopeptide antibiotics resistance protein